MTQRDRDKARAEATECEKSEVSRHNKVADSSRMRKLGRQVEGGREGGRMRERGDPPVIAAEAWGQIQGLGLILK